LVLLAEPGGNESTFTMGYVRCGVGVSTVSLRTHRILALGDEDLPSARKFGSGSSPFRVKAPSWPLLAVFLADRGAKRDRAVQE